MSLTRFVIISGLCAALGQTTGSAPTTNRAETLSELSGQYAASRDATIKRDLCIRAIDLGYISRSGSIESVSELCGKDFRRKVGRTDRGREYGIVYFSAPLGSYTDDQGQPAAGAFVGWYFVVEYSQETIEYYYLTNLHK